MLCTCCCSIIIDFWSGGRHVELLVSFLPVGHFYQDKGRQNFLGIFFFTFALDLASPHLDKLVDKILFRTETVSSATFHAFVESNTPVDLFYLFLLFCKTWTILNGHDWCRYPVLYIWMFHQNISIYLITCINVSNVNVLMYLMTMY